ncbi:MAG: lipoyl synthase [Bacteroidales bacterium]
MKNHLPKPDWLKIRLGDTEVFGKTSALLEHYGVHTICSSGKCPNQGECWSRGTATFMIAGDICTRSCKFCNTKTGRPLPLDEREGDRLARLVEKMGLKHVVLTSVDRDDLPDYGVSHWVDVIDKIKRKNPGVTIEALIPDFRGELNCVDRITATEVDVVAHNLETVCRLTPEVRSVASYCTSLQVIGRIARNRKIAKSGLMLGLGETEEEVLQAMHDLADVGCEVLTLGQYLQPTKEHYPVKEYITPEKFNEYRLEGFQIGFRKVESGPLVRSSYHAEKHLF